CLVFFDPTASYVIYTLSLHDALPIFWLIKKLFDSGSLIITNQIYKYLIFIGYIVLSFVIITKIPTLESVYVPGKIIGVFVLIWLDRKSTRLNSSHVKISYAVFCLKKK